MLFEQYKIYLEWVDRQAGRRLSTSCFFLAANSTLITVLGILTASPLQVVPGILAGVALCWVWHEMIVSNRGLATGRFKMISRIEEELPLALFDDEWEILERGENAATYKQFTKIEVWVPRIFGALYIVTFIIWILSYPIDAGDTATPDVSPIAGEAISQ